MYSAGPFSGCARLYAALVLGVGDGRVDDEEVDAIRMFARHHLSRRLSQQTLRSTLSLEKQQTGTFLPLSQVTVVVVIMAKR